MAMMVVYDPCGGMYDAVGTAAAVAVVGAGASGLKRRVYRGHRCGAWQCTLVRP